MKADGDGDGDGDGVDLANVKMSMNPFDEIAVEEAIRLKGPSRGGGVTERIPIIGKRARRGDKGADSCCALAPG